MSRSGLEPFSNQAQYLTRLGMTVQLVLGKNQLPVQRNFENATGSLHQAQFDAGILSPNLGRQTGGPGFVVSGNAILDAYQHRPSSSGYINLNFPEWVASVPSIYFFEACRLNLALPHSDISL